MAVVCLSYYCTFICHFRSGLSASVIKEYCIVLYCNTCYKCLHPFSQNSLSVSRFHVLKLYLSSVLIISLCTANLFTLSYLFCAIKPVNAFAVGTKQRILFFAVMKASCCLLPAACVLSCQVAEVSQCTAKAYKPYAAEPCWHQL